MTPLMQQYHTIKEQYADALVLFQVGDFYELFYRDAEQAAFFLGITLTSRGKVHGQPISLCGVPCHALDHYLVKLVNGGFRVVICNQQGEVVPGKLVERVVSHVVTPGTLTDEHLLNPLQTSRVVAVSLQGSSCALVYVEIITGICRGTVIDSEQYYLIEAELARLAPQEIIQDVAREDTRLDRILKSQEASVYKLVPVTQQDEQYTAWCAAHIMLSEQSIIQNSPALAMALRILYTYLQGHAFHAITHMRPLTLYNPDETLIIDAASQKSLAIVEDIHDAKSRHTLFAVLDHAATAMGSRCIRRWLLRPLRHMHALQQRLNAVNLLVQQTKIREQLFVDLQVIGDVERVVGRIAIDRALPRDYRALRDAIPAIMRCSILLRQTTLAIFLPTIMISHHQLAELHTYLTQALHDGDGNDMLIKEGFDQQLDNMRHLSMQGERALIVLEEQERRATGIGSLKIKYITMYGYVFETTRANRQQVPQHYELVHSLSNHDRFTTPELRARAAEIDHARKYATTRERELFAAVASLVREQTHMLRAMTDELARLDGLLGFAIAAVRHQLVFPRMTNEREFLLRGGRHIVVEASLANSGKMFIANDMHLTPQQRMWLITGPNMGGKSTFLRQAALAIIMAHAGSFVAAQEAVIPLTDRLFTRIGASDHVAQGKSTFFVEMEEVALICKSATSRSFVIIDELGRGTGTHDGMVLARAIIEYLDETIQLLGLCATHYHTLAAQLGAERSLGLYHAASRKTAQGMVFLHAIKPGNATSSFGLEVARCAGLPEHVVMRAHQLADISEPIDTEPFVQSTTGSTTTVTLACCCSMLDELDLDTMSPRQVYQYIESLQQKRSS